MSKPTKLSFDRSVFNSNAPLPALLLAIISFLGVQTTTFAQGSLTPPGAPAPAMKSLDQIEPRTPVDAAHAPGNIYAEFVISQPGSYYLTTNLFGINGKDGIQIITNDVTLDLNGFTLFGVPNAINGGIYISNQITSITVRNGVLSGWKSGAAIYCDGRNVTFEHLAVSSNYSGIFCAGGGVIKDCLFSGNATAGVDVNGSGSLVFGNDFVGNNTTNSSVIGSLEAFGANNRIEANHVTGSGTAGYGIFISGIFGLTNNILIRNSVEGGGTNNYFFNTSQVVGPIVTNTVSGIITNSNPWANFSF
ncbi:MAG: hypothetical protein JWQ04_475 [Pedosphaera sp.]|nr:hypothetical protein [Pedosphaera sp.]